MVAHWRALVVLPYLSQTLSMQLMYNHVANSGMRCSLVSCLCEIQLCFAESFHHFISPVSLMRQSFVCFRSELC